MRKKKERFIDDYVSGRKEAPFWRKNRNWRILYLTLPAAAGIVAYTLGQKPPRNIDVQYEQKEVAVPMAELMGYEKGHFSTLVVSKKDRTDAKTFRPTTAVKKFQYDTYEERSRQIEQLYFHDARTEDLVLQLKMPKKPIEINIGEKDYTLFAKKRGMYYEATIPLDQHKVNVADSTGTNKLELFIYYEQENKQQAPEDLTKHNEDAERYLIQLIH